MDIRKVWIFKISETVLPLTTTRILPTLLVAVCYGWTGPSADVNSSACPQTSEGLRPSDPAQASANVNGAKTAKKSPQTFIGRVELSSG